MVDKALIEELKKMRKNPETLSKKTVLTFFEVAKQLSVEDEDLKDSVEEADLCMQFVLTDSGEKFWIAARDGAISYGEGDGPDVTATLKGTVKTMSGILYQEIDPTSAFLSGALITEGDLQASMEFGEMAELAGEIIEDLMED
ncbi:MAG: SCP2 sterol-binding domain-containing protein [Promethearchaeota archaeon]|nr:MAG: SCP2 sterol-binding domain-containing protein [Candidatus Lokiarchaeota archaeon]